MESVDALVVGAGPAGSTVAVRLAERGHRVVVVEEHPRVGVPVQCAGLVSSRVLELAGSRSFVLGAVRGATIVGPGSARVSFRAPDPRAYVIDRAGLDRHLAERAARSGAEYRTGVRFDRRSSGGPDGSVVALTGPDGRATEMRARVVVGADGVASAVARAFRMRRPVEILPAFEAEVPGAGGDPEEVEVYLGRSIAPGLFGWSIPDLAGGARIGVAVNADGTSARSYYERLRSRIEAIRGRSLPGPTAYLVSGIPIGTVPRLSREGAVLVGDAGAQVKPLSGGGIFTGMRAAELAAGVLHDALGRRELGEAALAKYDRAWRSEFGAEFDRALYLRRLFLSLSDAELDSVVATLDRAQLKGTIVAFGDIDFPSGVAGALLRQSPSLLSLAPKALGALWGRGRGRVPDLDPGPRRNAA